MTLAQAAGAVMTADVLRLKPRTVTSYRQAYELHIGPSFGTRRLSTITRDEVQAWVVSLSVDKQLAPATVRSTFVCLRKVFRHALASNHLRYDPCQKITLPKQGHDMEPVGRALSAAEVDRLADELDAHPPYGLLVRFLAGTGLRRSELAGLRVRDLNLLQGHVEVRQTVQQIKDRGWHIDSPKSKNSRRDVPLLDSDLSDELAAFLAQHPRRHEADTPLWPGRRPADTPTVVHARRRGLQECWTTRVSSTQRRSIATTSDRPPHELGWTRFDCTTCGTPSGRCSPRQAPTSTRCRGGWGTTRLARPPASTCTCTRTTTKPRLTAWRR